MRRGEPGSGKAVSGPLPRFKSMASDDPWAWGEQTVRLQWSQGLGRWMMAGCWPDSRKMGARAKALSTKRVTVLRESLEKTLVCPEG